MRILQILDAVACPHFRPNRIRVQHESSRWWKPAADDIFVVFILHWTGARCGSDAYLYIVFVKHLVLMCSLETCCWWWHSWCVHWTPAGDEDSFCVCLNFVEHMLVMTTYLLCTSPCSAGKPNRKPWLAVYVGWLGFARCHGLWIRSTCVFGVADLPQLLPHHELFANKFYIDHEPLTLICLNEWLEYKVKCPMKEEDYDFYRQLPYVYKSENSSLRIT